MPLPQTNRRARFKAALALAGVSQREWAEKIGADIQHLHYLLREDTDELLRSIDETIRPSTEPDESLPRAA